ncbi:MAG: glycosyltransferase [Elusimicrobia bacterium]|nr:glycosyltransferase [Elusimicrobiota bacterium]
MRKLSIVIPAYNEEKLLGACLESVAAAFRSLGACSPAREVLVCDNNSTDSTARIAASSGAKVVFEPVNQIGRARNAGAAAASGDWLLFMDADSTLQTGTLKQLLAAIESGKYCGGGAEIDLDYIPNLAARALVNFWNVFFRVFKVAAGSFVFCRADAFAGIGGFGKDLYAGEELFLSRELKKWGRGRGLDFATLKGPHLSSGRKLKLYTGKEILATMLGCLRRPSSFFRNPKLLKMLYDGRR